MKAPATAKLDDLRLGDVVFYGETKFQIHRLAKPVVRDASMVDFGHGMCEAPTHIHVKCVGLEPREYFDAILKRTGAKYLGALKYARRTARTVPIGFGGGKLVEGMGDHDLVELLAGDADLWRAFLDERPHYIDVAYAAVVHADPTLKPAGDLRGLTKVDLMAYVAKLNGPLDRKELLRQVAAIEGKPWKPTSNTGYFTGENGPSVTASKALSVAGKGTRGRILYACGPAGEERAARVLARLGEEPARSAR